MRLWSIHPRYLDSKGLVALWREGLLAKAVLEGKTSGYKNHPQLERFKKLKDPVSGINCYLFYVANEAKMRGYDFDDTKLIVYSKNDYDPGNHEIITVSDGQINYEFSHLLRKLKIRDPRKYSELESISERGMIVSAHPMFKSTTGEVESWELVK